MSNIPVNIIDMVDRLTDTKTPFWIRNNTCMTLENIRDYCDNSIAKFNKQKVFELKKDAKK